MADNPHYLFQNVHQWVWSGFYTEAEVQQLLAEFIADEGVEAEANALQQAVATEWAAWQQAQAGWPATTDCDRLDAAFRQLNAQAIIALQNAGYTTSDGVTDCGEALHSLPDPVAVRGYCFYHGQDLERAVRGEGLWLAFGSLDDVEANVVAVGQQIQQALTAQGLTVAWNGTGTERISLPQLVWQRRPGTRPGLAGWYDQQRELQR